MHLDVNEIGGYHMRGQSAGFPASSTDVFDREFLTSYSPTEFDNYNSDDLVAIKSIDEEKFGLNRRFVSFVTNLEKSAQAGITDEMLKTFASVKELAYSFFLYNSTESTFEVFLCTKSDFSVSSFVDALIFKSYSYEVVGVSI